MRPPPTGDGKPFSIPKYLSHAQDLNVSLNKLSVQQIEAMMKVSPKLAAETKDLITSWTSSPSKQRAAVDSFLGDIYSGLQVQSWSDEDRQYAQDYLRILSGLYGVLKPLDGIYPYRHEMGYKIPNQLYKNMYEFWGNSVAKTLPDQMPIINLTAVEYSKVVTKYIDSNRFITPKFLTVSPKTGDPIFVTVHAKIARGAFANWLIKNRVDFPEELASYNDLGYKFNESLSTPNEPVFVCEKFEGSGLSVRLS